MSNVSRKTTFVIVCWNNRDLLADCFNSILEQSETDISIIMVDNGSDDDSVEYTKNSFPKIKVIKAERNLGFAKANNLGISEALNDESVGYVALLNTDARVEKSWLKQILDFAKLKPMGACFQGTTLDATDPEIVDSTHIFVARNSQATQANWRKKYKREQGPRKVFGVNAAACVISRAFIEAQPFGREFFDETMFMYLEDVDVAARATIMGWDNYLVPEARAYHIGSASSGKNPGYSLYMTFRNNSGMLYKNFPWRLLLKMWPKMVRSDIDTIIELRRRGDKPAMYKVIKGRLVGILRIPLFIVKRHRLKKVCQIDRKYLWVLMRDGN